MSFKDDFNLFVGASYGIFKGVKATDKGVVVKGIQSLNHLAKDSDVKALAWSDSNEEEILIGLSNQVVKTYDSKGKVFTCSTDMRISTEDVKSEGSICGLSRYDGALVTAVESGHVRVLRYNEEECINIHAGGPISRMRHSQSNKSIIGTGGLENELKLWDLCTGQKTFESKNVPNDYLQLRVKVWVTDHVFLPDSDKVVVGSKYGYVRLYDPKAQKRPVVKIDLPDKAVTCMTSSSQDHTVLCGLAKGDIISVDLRMGRSSQNYKGFLGAVRDIVCHPSEPYIASVGLDRFLRVHHLTSKELLLKEYLVTPMNCVLMRSNFTLKPSNMGKDKISKKTGPSVKLLSDGQSDNEDAQQFDEIFNAMEEVVDGSSNLRQKRKQSKLPQSKDEPSKRKKSSFLKNPFASKVNSSTTEKECTPSKTSPKKTLKKSPVKNGEDSDDDLMIISETVNNPSLIAEHGEENGSEPDEAEGDSDELNTDSSSQED